MDVSPTELKLRISAQRPCVSAMLAPLSQDQDRALRRGDQAHALQLVLEVLTLGELHHDEAAVGVVDEVQQANDVGVVEARQGLRFPLEAVLRGSRLQKKPHTPLPRHVVHHLLTRASDVSRDLGFCAVGGGVMFSVRG